MHSILDEMVERALNEQMDILMSKNDELRTKFEKLESATPPASISTRWRDQLSRTSNEISDLRFASIEYTNARIGVDEFLSNFAPLRIELVALDALLDEAVAK
ncbi:MAG: hypothetical protein RL716_115 [Actinomycetota bacterium]|jgi:hypothetical protein